VKPRRIRASVDEFRRRGGHHNRVELGERLNARREIDGFADGQPIPVGTVTHLADDRDASVKAHPYVDFSVKTLADSLVDDLDVFDDSKCGLGRENRVIFVRDRVAEIGHHAVAQKLRDVALVPMNGVLADALVAGQKIVQVFRVEPHRERRRVGEIAKEQGEMSALALGRPSADRLAARGAEPRAHQQGSPALSAQLARHRTLPLRGPSDPLHANF
jgi:hypothetical protein